MRTFVSLLKEKKFRIELRILKSRSTKKNKTLIPQIQCLERYQKKLVLLSTLGIISLASAPNRLIAQCDPVNDVFLVSTGETTFSKNSPQVAMDANGNYMVVWEEYTDNISGFDIYGRLYAADGTPMGYPLIINSFTENFQRSPAIAMQANGDFIVVWESDHEVGGNYEIYGRRFLANGAPIDVEFRINIFTVNSQQDPAVALDENGNFVVVWESENQENNDEALGVVARLFDSDGVPVTGDIHVNQFTTNTQGDPKVAMHSGGSFVVVWESYGQDGDQTAIYGRRFNSSGTPLDDEFQLNQYTTSSQSDPDIAMDCLGNFVVVWESFGQDGDLQAVVARRYQSDGTPFDNEFIVNTGTTGHQDEPSITLDCMGNFLIAWEDTRFDVFFPTIFSQCFNSLGERIGDEFQASLKDDIRLKNPSAKMNNDGLLVIAWDSRLEIGEITYEYGIQGQSFLCLKTSQPDPIPTVGHWGMIVLGLLFSILSWLGIKNKNLQAEKG